MKNLQSKELRMKKSFFPPTLAKQATRCECALNQSTVERWCRGKFLFHKYRKLTLFVCVCTNMTNLWWPLLNFPRNQDIFFASSLHDDGQNLQTSPGAVLYILGGKISKLGIGYKHRILCLLFGDKNFIVLLRKFYVHAKESKRFYPWFFSTSSRKYLPILYIKPIIIIL